MVENHGKRKALYTNRRGFILAFEEEFMAVGDAWRRVFPGGKGAGGRKVQKLFICGNHDWEGWKYGKYGVKKGPDAAELKRRIFTYNREDFWRKAFDEDFTEYPAIEVNGYRRSARRAEALASSW